LPTYKSESNGQASQGKVRNCYGSGRQIKKKKLLNRRGYKGNTY